MSFKFLFEPLIFCRGISRPVLRVAVALQLFLRIFNQDNLVENQLNKSEITCKFAQNYMRFDLQILLKVALIHNQPSTWEKKQYC